jgi:hypothetical protein
MIPLINDIKKTNLVRDKSLEIKAMRIEKWWLIAIDG